MEVTSLRKTHEISARLASGRKSNEGRTYAKRCCLEAAGWDEMDLMVGGFGARAEGTTPECKSKGRGAAAGILGAGAAVGEGRGAGATGRLASAGSPNNGKASSIGFGALVCIAAAVVEIAPLGVIIPSPAIVILGFGNADAI